MSDPATPVAVSAEHAPAEDSVEMFRDSSPLWMVAGVERPRYDDRTIAPSQLALCR